MGRFHMPAHNLDPKKDSMHHPDLRHHARDRIVAAEVMKLDLHEAELHATRGEPGVIETRKPRRAVLGPTKRALACTSRRSPTPKRVPLERMVEKRADAMRRAGQMPEDGALYRCRCGTSFTAAVTSCVACPSCGTGQPW
jgi:rubrerythrin